MSTKVVFSAEQTEEMRTMRRNGKSWKFLAAAFKCSTATVRRHMGVGFDNRRYYDSRISWRVLNIEGPHRAMVVPAHVITERDVRLATEPRDLTAELFGDPLPGYSALDRGGSDG